MGEALDEDTQMAIALSLSELEHTGSRHLWTHPLDRAVNSEGFDQEVGSPDYHHHQQQQHSPLVLCAGCGGSMKHGAQGSGLWNALGLFKLLPSSYVRAMGLCWHMECFRCGHCNARLETSFSIGEDRKPYHPSCYKLRFHPRCVVCADYLPMQAGRRIVWQLNEFWKEKTCPEHSNDGTPRCCGCTRLQPRGEHWVEVEHDRVLCFECLETVVVDTASAQPLYDHVVQFFAALNMHLPMKPPLLVVDSPALEEATNKQGLRPDGPTFHTRGLCLTEYSQTYVQRFIPFGFFRNTVSDIREPLGPARCEITAILVLSNLPRLLTGSILAHELMHAWLRLNHYKDLPLQVEEGLCQLMALLWLESSSSSGSTSGGNEGYEEKLAAFLGYQIRSDTSIVYGEGFRVAHDSFQRHGLAAVLQHVRMTKSLPV